MKTQHAIVALALAGLAAGFAAPAPTITRITIARIFNTISAL